MSLEFPTEHQNFYDIKRPQTGFDIVLTIIAVLASGFSGYTTYLGFSYDLPKFLSVVIAIIIGLGLLMINFKLRDHSISGDGILKPITAFLIFLIFSFISNTNAIYTYFLQNDIVEQTQVNAWQNFDKGTSMILAAIDDNSIILEAIRKKQNLDIARKNLYDQITDIANPGMGMKARLHLEEIETILEVRLTQLTPPSGSGSFSRYETYADKMDELILSLFKSKYKTSKIQKIEDLNNELQKLRLVYEEEITSKNFSSRITDLMKIDLESFKIKAKSLINFTDEIPEINDTADDLGSFQYTWNNFYNFINPSAIILSILLSIMLDTLTPVLFLLLYKEEFEY